MSISGNLVMSKKSSVVLLELEFVGRSISVEIRASMMEWWRDECMRNEDDLYVSSIDFITLVCDYEMWIVN